MAGATYRGLRLDRSVAEFHRAVDRLRWDTDHRRTEPQQPTAPAPRPTSTPEREGQPCLDLPA
jgi:hypothetical protein